MDNMYSKYIFVLTAVFLLNTLMVDAQDTNEIKARDGSITLNGNNQWWTGAIYIIPILIVIVILDFAIFGTFASRADELNPVSRFFFHARNGLHLLRNKKRRQYQEQYYHRQQRLLFKWPEMTGMPARMNRRIGSSVMKNGNVLFTKNVYIYFRFKYFWADSRLLTISVIF